MAHFLKVEGYSSLERDSESLAIINKDTTAYKNYMQGVQARRKEKESIQDAVREINTLKCEMHEIKALLMQMMEK